MKNKKSMKKTILLSAITAIAFGSIAVTTSYALFTDSAETNVTVTAGKVDVSVALGALSGTSPSTINADGTVPDGATNDALTPDGQGVLNFANGGTAKVSGSDIIINNIAPGDSVKVPLTFTNNSTIAIKYKGKLTVSGSSAYDVTFNGLDKRKWKSVAAGADIVESGTEAYVSISLPATATDQEIAETTITVGVEAVQGNAVTYDDVDNFSELSNYSFTYDSATTDSTIVLDGKDRTVANWTDAWFATDVTIKNLTFLQGATFSAQTAKLTKKVTITFENCTFYACQQENIDIQNWQNQGGGNNNLSNSGDGLCLDVETDDSNSENAQLSYVNVVIKNCEFIGEDDVTLDRKGYKYYDVSNSKWMDKSKGRGHAIGINIINGQGGANSVTIEGNTMTGLRGSAMNIYTFNYPVTIKDNIINSWGRNNLTANLKDSDSAIRGTKGTGELTLSSNYFGLDENIQVVGTENCGYYHVNVNNYDSNTSGSRSKGTY